MTDEGQEPRRRWWIFPLAAVGALILLFVILTAQAYRGLQSGVNRLRGEGFTTGTTAAGGSDTASSSQHADDDPTLGTPGAPIAVIAFEDFQCPFCKEAYPIIRQLLARYPDRIHFTYRDFPVADTHPFAKRAAQAGQCAWEQGANQFWTFHDRVYQNQSLISDQNLENWAQLSGVDLPRFRSCLTSGKYRGEVQQDFDDGVAAGVRGTPTFFINGKKVEGVIPASAWEQLVKKI